jgi:SAM-dependent methyltransferase
LPRSTSWLEFHDDAYRFLYGGTLTGERSETEVAGVVRLLALPEGARLLDLCCGDGRHAVPLQRRGYRVVGLDGAPVMLQRAKERGERILGRGQGPSWVRADARAVPLRPDFDAVVCLFNSLALGDDDENARSFLREARSVLRANGQLIVELVHRDQHARVQDPGRQMMNDLIDGRMVQTETWMDPIAGLQHAIFRWEENGVRREKRLVYRTYSATETVRMIRAAGFSRVDVYGEYDGRGFNLDSPCLVAHGRL